MWPASGSRETPGRRMSRGVGLRGGGRRRPCHARARQPGRLPRGEARGPGARALCRRPSRRPGRAAERRDVSGGVSRAPAHVGGCRLSPRRVPARQHRPPRAGEPRRRAGPRALPHARRGGYRVPRPDRVVDLQPRQRAVRPAQGIHAAGRGLQQRLVRPGRHAVSARRLDVGRLPADRQAADA